MTTELDQTATKIWWLVNDKETMPPTTAEIAEVKLWIIEVEKEITLQQQELLKLRRNNGSHTTG